MLHSDESTEEVLILGAGPNALALALRMVEEKAMDVFNASQVARMQFWESRRSREDSRVPGWKKLAQDKIRIFDRDGKWLSQWTRQFEALEIEFMRSPVSVHLDLFDSNALREFAFRRDRCAEICDLGGFDEILSVYFSKRSARSVRAISINEQSRLLFDIPKSRLFIDFFSDLIERYELENVVEKQTVQTISFDQDSNLFSVWNTEGQLFRFRRIVYAGGVIQTPRIPDVFQNLDLFGSKIFHSSHLIGHCPGKLSRESLGGKSVAVLGGGLTAAQIALLGSTHGAKQVYLISRDYLRIKHFDFDVSWISRSRNAQHTDFYLSDLKTKEKLLKQVRQGGSITPEIMARLKLDRNVLIMQCRQVIGISLKQEGIQDCPMILELDNRQTVCVDIVILATGSDPDVRTNPLFQDLLSNHDLPFNKQSGLPVLNPDLSWENLPLHFTGAYASLELGPHASNLIGALTSSSRIFDSISSRLSSVEDQHEIESSELVQRYVFGNPFEILEVES